MRSSSDKPLASNDLRPLCTHVSEWVLIQNDDDFEYITETRAKIRGANGRGGEKNK